MRFPKLCKHKRTGRAYATDPASGKQVWFGAHGSTEADQEYRRWVASLASRRADVGSGTLPGQSLSINTLAADYLDWATRYYRKRGTITSEVRLIRSAVKMLLSLFSGTDAAAFGPSQLKAYRQAYVDGGWNITSVNKQVGKLVRMFRWGVENELTKPDQLVSLRAVKHLAPGRTEASVPDPIRAADPEHVRATAAAARPVIGAMLLTHLATGMRTQELLEMAVDRIDMTIEPWIYIPEHHKTEHAGKSRTIYLGPEARIILAPWIEKAKQRADGRLWIGLRGPLKEQSYYRGVRRARKLAGIPWFRPLQIRHTAATRFRKEAGIEGAQALLGHSHLRTTEIYAEQRHDIAKETIERVG